MNKLLLFAFLLPLFSCNNTDRDLNAVHKEIGERYFRGVYGCDPSVVDDLTADDVFISYPVFKQLFNKSAIRGRKAVKDFVNGFCSRWKDSQITIHETVAEGNTTIFLWSFKALYVGPAQPNGPANNTEHSWGGITLIRFNDQGKIIEETGEESTPGPYSRINKTIP